MRLCGSFILEQNRGAKSPAQLEDYRIRDRRSRVISLTCCTNVYTQCLEQGLSTMHARVAFFDHLEVVVSRIAVEVSAQAILTAFGRFHGDLDIDVVLLPVDKEPNPFWKLHVDASVAHSRIFDQMGIRVSLRMYNSFDVEF